jgi:hypothetical protein
VDYYDVKAQEATVATWKAWLFFNPKVLS